MEFKAKDRRLENVPELRKLQLCQLYILDIIDEICSKEGIQYFLACGTLIGCMRHKGFIPWDDDLDIVMPISDYKRFIRIAPNYLPYTFTLQTPQNIPGAYEWFTKVRDNTTLFIEPTSNLANPSGVFVDIFPFEECPKLPFKIHCIMRRGLSLCWRRERLHRSAGHRYVSGCFVSGFIALFWKISRIILRLLYKSMCIFGSELNYSPEHGAVSELKGFKYDTIFPLKKGILKGENIQFLMMPMAC